MSLKERLMADLKTAMKEKDNEELISEVYEKVVKAMKEKREE